MKKYLAFILTLAVTGVLFYGCENKSDSGLASNNGTTGNGGSLSRFTIVDDHLYTINGNVLKIFQISNTEQPVHVKDMQMGQGVETIFPFEGYLLFGTASGLLIYDISNPENPEFKSNYTHVVSCDPVVAEGNYAFVTLSSGTRCQRGQNSLDVVDISNMSSPQLKNSMFMNMPKGLAVKGSKLIVCESNGLTALDVSNPQLPLFKSRVNLSGLNDVIIDGNRAVAIGSKGLYQYYCTDLSNMTLASVMPVQ